MSIGIALSSGASAKLIVDSSRFVPFADFTQFITNGWGNAKPVLTSVSPNSQSVRPSPSGTFVVASMVHFTDGRPDKDHYRRFSIKSFIGNDDFRAMEEVVGRRYRRLAEEKKPFPDLVVIDGGRGQIGAAGPFGIGQAVSHAISAASTG